MSNTNETMERTNVIAINNMGSLKRFAKTAQVILYRTTLGAAENQVLLPLRKGAFVTAIAPFANNVDVLAEMDGNSVLTVSE